MMPSQSGRGRALDASENTLTDAIWPARDEPRRRCRRHIRRPVNNNRIGAILDRKLDVGVADGNLMHFAAVRACDVQGLLPGGGQAFCVSCDLCRGSPFGIGASEEKRSHITLPAGLRHWERWMVPKVPRPGRSLRSLSRLSVRDPLHRASRDARTRSACGPGGCDNNSTLSRSFEQTRTSLWSPPPDKQVGNACPRNNQQDAESNESSKMLFHDYPRMMRTPNNPEVAE